MEIQHFHPAGESKIVGIILAAGLSRRMGRVKSLLPWRGGPLLDKVIENAYHSKLDSLIVVLGYEAENIRKRIDFKGAKVIENSDYRAGQSSSLQTGLDALPTGTDGVLFLLGDQPFIDHKIIDQLIAGFKKLQSPLIIPTYRGKRGNPVLVHSSIFDMVKGITGDRGARALFSRLSNRLQEVDVSDPAIFVDIDTIEEYRELVDRQDLDNLNPN